MRAMTDGVALCLVRDPTRSAPWLVTTTALYQVRPSQISRPPQECGRVQRGDVCCLHQSYYARCAHRY